MQQHEIMMFACRRRGTLCCCNITSRIFHDIDGITVTITNVGYGPHEQGRILTCIADGVGH